MGDEEVKTTEVVITEEVTKVVEEVKEEVNEKVEKVIEMIGIDSKVLEPIVEEVISQVADAVTTVVSEAVVTVTESLGLKMVSESSLTDDQKKLATQIYDSTKAAIQSFIADQSLNNTLKITKTLGQIIKQLENAKVDGSIYTGADKKAVAIQLGRILIKEVTPDDKGEAEILMVYDLVAEPTLEAMIDVSRAVNVAVQEMATKCCPGILEFFKRAKKTA